MFEVKEGNAQLVHMNTRLEKHGDEDKVAVDLKFLWETGNDCLAMFAPELRSCLYKRPDGPQAELPGTSGVDHLVALRFPAMDPFKWSGHDVVGGRLVFHTGVTAKSHVNLKDVTFGKFKLDPKEGGSVMVEFVAQLLPSDAEMGKLSKFLKDKQCTVSVVPPGDEAEEEGAEKN